VRVLLIVLMAVGSVLMWLGFPFALIYGVSQAQESSAPSLGPYLLVVAGIAIEMVVVGKLLAAMDRAYGRRAGTASDRPARRSWNRSLRAERDPTRRQSVLDVVMILSVAVAGTSLLVWFFGFAGSSLPGG
jgi:hypothetical protein